MNESVPAGVVLHWHGVEVPGAMDGTAGVTQDAVPPGGEFVYRFRADHAGTFWYHSHQVTHEQVERGLFGALVITPRTPRRRGGRARARAPLRRAAAPSTAGRATCPSRRRRAPRCGCGW